MPVVFRYQGFKFFFYSNEGNPLEPPHIHVRAAGKEAKFWLSPEVWLADIDGFLHATPTGREALELSVHGIHWDELDEDISVQGLLRGLGDQTRPNRDQAA